MQERIQRMREALAEMHKECFEYPFSEYLVADFIGPNGTLEAIETVQNIGCSERDGNLLLMHLLDKLRVDSTSICDAINAVYWDAEESVYRRHQRNRIIETLGFVGEECADMIVSLQNALQPRKMRL